MTECVFCRIIAGQAPAKVFYRDEQVIAFQDIHPVAPVHILIVPIKHLESINAMTEADKPLIGHLFWIAHQLAAEHGIAESGYRSIINTGRDSGQAVFHLHLHLIGGQRVRFPMG